MKKIYSMIFGGFCGDCSTAVSFRVETAEVLANQYQVSGLIVKCNCEKRPEINLMLESTTESTFV